MILNTMSINVKLLKKTNNYMKILTIINDYLKNDFIQ